MPLDALPRSLTEPVLDKDGKEIGRKSKMHWDWPWPFSKIPRSWTAWRWGEPRLAKGGAVCAYPHEPGLYFPCPPHRPKPIAPPGTWHVALFPGAPWWAWPALYFSWSGRRAKDGKFRNVRVGPRWDDVDNYVNWAGLVFPFLPSSRRYDGTDQQNTGTGPDKKP